MIGALLVFSMVSPLFQVVGQPSPEEICYKQDLQPFESENAIAKKFIGQSIEVEGGRLEKVKVFLTTKRISGTEELFVATNCPLPHQQRQAVVRHQYEELQKMSPKSMHDIAQDKLNDYILKGREFEKYRGNPLRQFNDVEVNVLGVVAWLDSLKEAAHFRDHLLYSSTGYPLKANFTVREKDASLNSYLFSIFGKAGIVPDRSTFDAVFENETEIIVSKKFLTSPVWGSLDLGTPGSLKLALDENGSTASLQRVRRSGSWGNLVETGSTWREFPSQSAVSPDAANEKGAVRSLGELDGSLPEVNRRFANVEVACIVPDPSTFERVFKRAQKQRDVAELDSVAESFRENGAKVFRERGGMEDILRQYAGSNSKDLVCLVGHSRLGKDGKREFCFPNGDQVSLDVIHQYAADHQIELLILTCHSSDIEAYRKITFVEAGNLVSKVKRRPGVFSRQETIDLLKREMINRDIQQIGVCFIAAVGTGAGASILEYSFDEEGTPEGNEEDTPE